MWKGVVNVATPVEVNKSSSRHPLGCCYCCCWDSIGLGLRSKDTREESKKDSVLKCHEAGGD